MKLTEWYVSGYRSIGKGQFSPDQFNILIGRNNSGKSNILKSIKDVGGILLPNNRSHPFKRPRAGDIITRNNSHTEVKFDFEYNIESEFEYLAQRLKNHELDEEYIDIVKEQKAFSKIRFVQIQTENGNTTKWSTNLPNKGMTEVEGPGTTMAVRELPPKDINRSGNTTHVKQILNNTLKQGYRKVDLVESFREPQEEMGASRVDTLNRTGEDLVQVLDTMARNHPDEFEKVEGTYTEIMEGVTGLRTPFVSNQNTTVMVDEKGFNDGFSLDEISAGSKEILTILTKIVKSEKNSEILLVEEPELHIHPNAQQAVYNLMRDVCSNGGPQIFLTTHSDVFVNHTDSSNIVSVKRDIESSIEKLDRGSIDDVLEYLGYEKSEVFQSKGAVFVEGISDQKIFKQFAILLSEGGYIDESLDELGITVRPLGGDRLTRHGGELHNSLSHLRIPHFFITDSDDQSPAKKSEKMQEDLNRAELHVLNEYCIESYLLKNPYSIANAFDLSEDAVKDYIDEAEERPNKKSVLDDLLKDLAGHQGGYDEREHSWIIARHTNVEDIPKELTTLISRMEDLTEEH